MVKSRSVIRCKKKCEKRAGAGEKLSPIFRAATAPFPKSRASYFRSARFNTSALYYLRAWHRLVNSGSPLSFPVCSGRGDSTSFNKTIIPLALVGYEMILANSALRVSLVIFHLKSNAHSWIIVNYMWVSPFQNWRW